MFSASEIRGFRAFDGFRFKPDFQTIDNYLAYSYAIPPRTLALDIKQVRHGEYIIFNKGRLVNESIFVRPATRILTSGNEKEWATELERQLSASVLKRMNSSKRVGFLVSGGHDTAAMIAAGSVQSSARIKTFTLRFLGCPEMDESSHARNVSKHFGTEHSEVDVTSSCIEFLPQISTFASLPPVNASSLLSFSLFKQISPSVDTVLCGDGGNDLLGGHYRYNQILAYARNHQSPPLRRFLFAYGRRAYHMLKRTPLEPVLQTVARSFFARIGKDVSEGNVAKMDKSEFDEIVASYLIPIRFGARKTSGFCIQKSASVNSRR